MVFCVTLSVCQQFWLTLLYNIASSHWDLWWFIHAQLSWVPATAFQSGWCLDFNGAPAAAWFFFFLLQIQFRLNFGQASAVRQMVSYLISEYFGIQTFVEFVVVSMTARCSGPVAATEAKIVTLPPPCKTAGPRCLCWFTAFGFPQKSNTGVVLCIMAKHIHFSLICPKDIVSGVCLRSSANLNHAANF